MPFAPFFASLVVTVAFVPLVRRWAIRLGVLDIPGAARKQHAGPVPLLGGLAIFAAVALVAIAYRGELLGGFLLGKHLVGILIGALVLVLGGALDDRYNLKPKWQLFFPALASLIVIASGLGVAYVTNPFGGILRLDLWTWKLFSAGGVPYQLTFPGDLFTFVWLLIMSYATKLLDGVDGLVSGLTFVGAAVVVLLSLTPEVGQPELARLAAIVAGAFLGFLVWNRPRAGIFLGEGGSTLAGWLLGVMAVMSGAKIGITLLIMAVPLLDLAWTLVRRVLVERRPWNQGDRGHLHFRLIDFGFSPWATDLFYWVFAAGFGAVGLFIRSQDKALALVLLSALFATVTFAMRHWSLKSRAR
jgi:UDP-GlcNAc:undecaprenyl-phosphate GlcNAc-1-phosphate transferase